MLLSNGEKAHDFTLIQKANHILKALNLGSAIVSVQQLRITAPVVFLKIYEATYHDHLRNIVYNPTNSREHELNMNNIISALREKYSTDIPSYITGKSIVNGEAPAINLLVDIFYQYVIDISYPKQSQFSPSNELEAMPKDIPEQHKKLKKSPEKQRNITTSQNRGEFIPPEFKNMIARLTDIESKLEKEKESKSLYNEIYDHPSHPHSDYNNNNYHTNTNTNNNIHRKKKSRKSNRYLNGKSTSSTFVEEDIICDPHNTPHFTHQRSLVHHKNNINNTLVIDTSASYRSSSNKNNEEEEDVDVIMANEDIYSPPRPLTAPNLTQRYSPPAPEYKRSFSPRHEIRRSVEDRKDDIIEYGTKVSMQNYSGGVNNVSPSKAYNMSYANADYEYSRHTGRRELNFNRKSKEKRQNEELNNIVPLYKTQYENTVNNMDKYTHDLNTTTNSYISRIHNIKSLSNEYNSNNQDINSDIDYNHIITNYPTHGFLNTNDMSKLDLIVTIEHCVNCSFHSLSLRHNSYEYVLYANNTLRYLTQLIHEYCPIARVGVISYPAHITPKCVKHNNHKIDSFEVSILFKDEDNVLFKDILHSKLQSKRWPSKVVLEKRLLGFLSQCGVACHRRPGPDEHYTSIGYDGLYPYPVGNGHWCDVVLSNDRWKFMLLNTYPNSSRADTAAIQNNIQKQLNSPHSKSPFPNDQDSDSEVMLTLPYVQWVFDARNVPSLIDSGALMKDMLVRVNNIRNRYNGTEKYSLVGMITNITQPSDKSGNRNRSETTEPVYEVQLKYHHGKVRVLKADLSDVNSDVDMRKRLLMSNIGSDGIPTVLSDVLTFAVENKMNKWKVIGSDDKEICSDYDEIVNDLGSTAYRSPSKNGGGSPSRPFSPGKVNNINSPGRISSPSKESKKLIKSYFLSRSSYFHQMRFLVWQYINHQSRKNNNSNDSYNNSEMPPAAIDNEKLIAQLCYSEEMIEYLYDKFGQTNILDVDNFTHITKSRVINMTRLEELVSPKSHKAIYLSPLTHNNLIKLDSTTSNNNNDSSTNPEIKKSNSNYISTINNDFDDDDDMIFDVSADDRYENYGGEQQNQSYAGDNNKKVDLVSQHTDDDDSNVFPLLHDDSVGDIKKESPKIESTAIEPKKETTEPTSVKLVQKEPMPIQPDILYDLVVRKIELSELLQTELAGKNDPFVILSLDCVSFRYKTSCKENVGLEAIWNDLSAPFQAVGSVLLSNPLKVQVYDRNTLRESVLIGEGSAKIVNDSILSVKLSNKDKNCAAGLADIVFDVKINNTVKLSEFKVGDRVEGKYRGEGMWYSAHVCKVNSDGTYDLDYDDGDHEDAVIAGYVRYPNSDNYDVTTSDAANIHQSFDIGDKVEICDKDGQSWKVGTIAKSNNNGTFDVKYDDGTSVNQVLVDKIRYHNECTYKEGDRVEGRFGRRDKWFPAKVSRVNRDGTYDLEYDDGDRESNVIPSCVRLLNSNSNAEILTSASPTLKEGDRVEGKYKGGDKWFKGRVTRVNRDGTYDLEYDDGDREFKVISGCVRLEKKPETRLYEDEGDPFADDDSPRKDDFVMDANQWYDVTITKIRASSLSNVEMIGKNDPYVILTLEQASFKFISEVLKDSGNKGLWDELSASFQALGSVLLNTPLKVQVYDQNTVSKDVLIGEGSAKIVNDSILNISLSIPTNKSASRGNVEITLSVKPATNIHVNNSTNISGKAITATENKTENSKKTTASSTIPPSDTAQNSSKQQIVKEPSKANSDGPLKAGTKVEAFYNGAYSPGVIVKLQKDGTFDVNFDNTDDIVYHMQRNLIRKL